jgi:cation diffusion facilitator CzcD-associated flavoprotein CzcO
MSAAKPRIAILGAGPTGLAAALEAAAGGYPFTVYEQAPAPAGNVRRWGHVRLFTPWAMNVSPGMRRELPALADLDPEETPTGHELADRLLEPVAALPAIAPHLCLGTTVLSVGRQGLLKQEEISSPARAARPFRLLLGDAAGREWAAAADVVLDATGTWGFPNSLGDAGIPAPGERALAGEIRRDLPDIAADPADWAGRTVLLAGAGHSAQTVARELASLAWEAPGTRLVWVLRKTAAGWGSPAADPLPGRAQLAAEAAALAGGSHPAVEARRGMVVEEIARPNGQFRVVLRRRVEGRAAGANDVESPASGARGAAEEVEVVSADRVLALTGSVGDHGLYRQLQVHECYATCGPMKLSAALLGAGGDCLAQTTHGADTLVNPEPGFFILGSKSYGRHNSFLLRIGWEQVAEVFGLLAGATPAA